ncbi:MAG: VWA domain-containing protein [Spirochaetes bacterium]|nr:VWA domain-containing protein [Spirochaetota bacterium]
MNFERLWMLNFLWVLPLIVFAALFEYRKKKAALSRFAESSLIAKLTGSEHKDRVVLRIFMLCLSFILLIIALAGPRWGSHYQEVSRRGVDIIIAVDVSPSMLVQDVKPSRIERARREIQDFIKVVQGDRVGLVAFSGTAFVLCPLTLDYGALDMFLSELSPGVIPVKGTDIGAAIDMSVSSFDEKANTDRVILLITDGEDNEGLGLKAAQKAAEKNVKVFVFGIGDPTGGPVPSPDNSGGFIKERGKLVLSKLDEKTLAKIASTTDGSYVRSVAGDLDLDLLYFSGIKLKTESAELKSGKIKVYEERFMFFILGAFVLLLLEGFVNANILQKK